MQIAKEEFVPEVEAELKTLYSLLPSMIKQVQNINEGNSDIPVLFLTEAPKPTLITVELSRISKAVYYSGLLVHHRPKQIAVWLNQYCQVVEKKRWNNCIN